MPIAEIIAIGTEILLGEIVDTNSQFIARSLREIGIDLYRIMTTGDNTERIAKAIQESLSRCSILITTGGLGPTIDDPTRDAVGLALNVGLIFHPELWDQIQSRFARYKRQPTQNNMRQAYIPEGSIPVENPVGTAPAFICEIGEKTIISLPGVPKEMEFLMRNAILPYLRKRFQVHALIKSRVLHSVGIGESQIDSLIGDLETLNNPTVGLAAHSGQVDVRITAKAKNEAEAMRLIQPIENTLRELLGTTIYGADEETLEEVALRTITQKGWKLVVVEAGLNGFLVKRLSTNGKPFLRGEVLLEVKDPDELSDIIQEYRRVNNSDIGLGTAIFSNKEQQEICIVLITPDGEKRFSRSYGGPPEYAARYTFNHILDILRGI
jgi:nicotinamide-nucleotide amidase